MLCAVVGLWIWQSSRPKAQEPWNNKAIKATFTDLSMVTDADKFYFDFRYSLENTTEKDYTVPADAKLMLRVAKDMSFRDIPEMTWEQGSFIPSRQKVNIKVRLPFPLSDFNISQKKLDDLKEMTQFADRRLAEMDGFALFDSADRYRVDFPNGWPDVATKAAQQQPSAGATNTAGTSLAGATKAYRGFTYSFDGQAWKKGQAAKKYNPQTKGLEPWSDDQYDPLGLFTKEEKSRRLLTEAQIRQVANQFSVSYEEAWEDAKAQGYQVPPKQ